MNLILVKLFFVSFSAIYAQAEVSEDYDLKEDQVENLDEVATNDYPNLFKSYVKRTFRRPKDSQKKFVQALGDFDWTLALHEYNRAIVVPKKVNTEMRALRSFLLFKNYFHKESLESLLALDRKKISVDLLQFWKWEVKRTDLAWGKVSVNVEEGWRKVFNVPDNRFKDAISSYKKGEIEKAQNQLNKMAVEEAEDNELDLIQINLARIFFELSKYTEAIKYYEKIKVSSEFWTDAQEEIAWSYLKLGQPQNAISRIRSLITDTLRGQVGPESFLVGAITYLKVCDLTKALELVNKFGPWFKERTLRLNDLASGSNAEDIKEVLALFKDGKFKFDDLGKVAKNLPRQFTRDEVITTAAQELNFLTLQSQCENKLNELEATLGGGNLEVHDLISETKRKLKLTEARVSERLRELAKTEVKYIRNILSKMHIVEAEVIQRSGVGHKLAANDNIIGNLKGKIKVASANEIFFLADEEVWIDEIGRYTVDLKKSCQRGQK